MARVERGWSARDRDARARAAGGLAGWRAGGRSRETCCCAMSLGAFLRCSRIPSVMPPRPMAVQKLMAKRVSFGVPSGKRPEKEDCGATGGGRRVAGAGCWVGGGWVAVGVPGAARQVPAAVALEQGAGGGVAPTCMCSSLRRSRSSLRPMYSATSWKSTLMKIRDEEVVSSSVITRYSITPHGSASEWIRCAKNLATLRSLFVSSRWIIAYCLANISSNSTW